MPIPSLDSVQGQPVRTINPGDVMVKIGDGTVPSQYLSVDTSGRVTIKLNDGSGNAITSQINGAQRAIDMGINVAGVQIDPRQTGIYNSALPTLASGSFATPEVDVNGRMIVVSQSAANFLVTASQGTSPWITSDLADGSVAPGIAGTKSMLSGGVYTSAGVTLTTGQQSAIQLTSVGALIIRPLLFSTDSVTTRLQDGLGNAITSTVATGSKQALDVNIANPLPAGTNNIGSVNQGTNPWVTSDLADGSVAPGIAGTKSMLGGGIYNAIPPVLTTGQQAALQLNAAGALLVSISSVTPGNPINNYYTSPTGVAYGGSDTHLYTISAGKILNVKKFFASAPGRIRIDVQLSTNGTTFTTVFTAYNSTATPNITIDMDEFYVPDSGTGSSVQIVRYNEEPGSTFGISSTISGTEN